MAKLVVYAKTNDGAIQMAPDDVEVRYVGVEDVEQTDVNLVADFEPRTNKLLAPTIISDSFVATVRALADGSVVTDVEFEIEEVFGADSYEIRYA